MKRPPFLSVMAMINCIMVVSKCSDESIFQSINVNAACRLIDGFEPPCSQDENYPWLCCNFECGTDSDPYAHLATDYDYGNLSSIVDRFYEELSVTTESHARTISSTTPAMCQRFSTEPPMELPCETTYRTLDGTCNNLVVNKYYGSTGTIYPRMVESYYDDGTNSPRTAAFSGGMLPSPRNIVNVVNQNDASPVNNTVNLLFVAWGQFIGYDLSKGHQYSHLGYRVDCCSENLNPKYKSICLPINVPDDDPFYSVYNVRCLHFARSVGTIKEGVREQTNSATSFLDVSQVYGSDQETADNLRTFENGMLTTKKAENGNGVLLPMLKGDECKGITHLPLCFLSGDNRANEHAALTFLYQFVVNKHNDIAQTLFKLNPHWSDEILYQNARKIIIAIIQHVTYNEYLPILLGSNAMVKYNIALKTRGYADVYNSSINAGVYNEFAHAAFRSGAGLATSRWIFSNTNKKITFSDTYKSVANFNRNSMYSLIIEEGLQKSPDQKIPFYINEELAGHLFQEGTMKHGHDLYSVTIQRGRDHGLAPYIQVRKKRSLSELNDFEQLKTIMQPMVVERLKTVYGNVQDVDLFVGGFLETPITDGNLGPTFLDIIAEQFRIIRHGDRLWYENGGPDAPFTTDQLETIRKITMSQLFCKQGVLQVARFAFRLVCPKNTYIFCDIFKPLTWNAWKDE